MPVSVHRSAGAVDSRGRGCRCRSAVRDGRGLQLGQQRQGERRVAIVPDGAHDAEALLLAPDGRLHVVTKADTGVVALYRFPSELQAGGTMRLERVGDPHPRENKDRITDGAVSPDGRWVALRSTEALMLYRATDLLTGNWREVGRVPLGTLAEPQGEGVTFAADNALYLISEGGGKKQPGRFARLTCALTECSA